LKWSVMPEALKILLYMFAALYSFVILALAVATLSVIRNVKAFILAVLMAIGYGILLLLIAAAT